MNTATFLIVLLSFTGAAVVVIGAIVLAIGHLRRLPARPVPGQLSPEDLEDLRARLAELEERDVRVEEIEERLDFVERMLGGSRDIKTLPNPLEK